MNSFLLCLSFTLFVACYGQKTFHASRVTVSNLPSVAGSLSATIYYDSANGVMQTNYDIGLTEIHNFTEKVLYRKCNTTTCSAETIDYSDYGFYTPFPGEIPSTNITCTTAATGSSFYRNAQGNNAVTLIAFDTKGRICKAILNSGKTFTFKSFGTKIGVYNITGCPKKQCSQKLDVMLVWDESASIQDDQWSVMKSFSINLANTFAVSETGGKIGLVVFSSVAQLKFTFQGDQQSLTNSLNSLQRTYKSGTNTHLGLSLAFDTWDRDGRKGDVKLLTILITDGFCGNCGKLVNPAYKNLPIGYLFAIGIGNAVPSQLNIFASGTDGYEVINGHNISTSVLVADWYILGSKLDQIAAATCTEFPGNPCGSSCNGFCGCNQECICPDDCSSFNNTCNLGICTKTSNGAGCYSQLREDPCDDNDVCTNEYCSGDMCIRSNVECEDIACYDKICDPKKGCVYSKTVCKDGDPCTDEFCDVTNNTCNYDKPRACDACLYLNLTDVTCSVGKSACENWDCFQPTNSTAECQKVSEVNCNDFNACTIDSCDKVTGCVNTLRTDCATTDMCATASCDPEIGCIVTPFNGTQICDDLNQCTLDSCNSTIGCVYQDVTCNSTFPCKDAVCNPLRGCELRPKNCADEPGIREKLGDCYAAICNDGSGYINSSVDEQLGCYLELQSDTVVDDCGVCRGDGSSCGFPLTTAEVAGISAGIIGAIAAAAAVFAIIGAVSGKKGYDAYLRHKDTMEGVQNNPLYDDNGRAGFNPFYGVSQVFKTSYRNLKAKVSSRNLNADVELQ